MDAGLHAEELARLDEMYSDALADEERGSNYEAKLNNRANGPSCHSRKDGSIGSHTTVKDEECAICMTALKESESIDLPGCKHQFHKACVYKWLTTKSRCPLCQRDVRSDIS